VFEGDPVLFNPYGIILVNPERHPARWASRRPRQGQAFIDSSSSLGRNPGQAGDRQLPKTCGRRAAPAEVLSGHVLAEAGPDPAPGHRPPFRAWRSRPATPPGSRARARAGADVPGALRRHGGGLLALAPAGDGRPDRRHPARRDRPLARKVASAWACRSWSCWQRRWRRLAAGPAGTVTLPGWRRRAFAIVPPESEGLPAGAPPGTALTVRISVMPKFGSRPAAPAQDQFLQVLSRDAAEAAFLAALRPRRWAPWRWASTSCLGRVLAQDIAAPVDAPPFDRADGRRLRRARRRSLRGLRRRTRAARLNPETIACGTAPALPVTPGTATPIATGGPIPRGADAVVMIEHTEPEGDGIAVARPSHRAASCRLRRLRHRAGPDAAAQGHGDRRARGGDAGRRRARPSAGLAPAAGGGAVHGR
jgi:hypothetical protein